MDDPLTTASLPPIAIIGMAGRFPGAGDVESFWTNLVDGVDAVSRFSREEMLAAGVDPDLVDRPGYVGAGGVLDGVELFDAALFRVTPGEAALMDPQQRLCLECAWEAFENAGYRPGSITAPVAVYIGASLSTYLLYNVSRRPDIVKRFGGLRTLLGNDKDHLATLVAHQLNLTGPAVNISSACSTSLVAVTFACQSLWSHQVDLALAGAAAVQVPQRRGYLHEPGGIYSPDGHCRAFDRGAQGTVGGSGVGLVLLKRAADAIADGDHVYAVIRGAAVNNDGSLRAGYTAPSGAGQAAVISDALAIAGVHPETVTYLEAHGTGTMLGDAVEIAALEDAFGRQTAKRGFCALGSVKSSIGHLDAAAGVASLIKTALALERRRIPPAVHFTEANPALGLDESPFYVPTRPLDWPLRGAPRRRAGVSSFGMGGTNAHVVLEEAPEVDAAPPVREWQLVTASARTPASLGRALSELADRIDRNPAPPLADVAYTLAAGRQAWPFRCAFVCRDRDEAIATARSRAAAAPSPHDRAGERKVIVRLPDEGTTRCDPFDLSAHEPAFRTPFEQCLALVRDTLGVRLDGPFDASDEVARGLLAWSSAYAAARMWMAWGVTPDGFSGRGAGALVAACLAGAIPLDAMFRLVRAHAGATRASADVASRLSGVLAGVTLRAPGVPVAVGAGSWVTREHPPAAAVWIDAVAHAAPAQAGTDDRFPGGGETEWLDGEIDSVPALLDRLGRLWVSGVPVAWDRFYAGERRRRVALPATPFERQRFWIDPPSSRATERDRSEAAGPALARRFGADDAATVALEASTLAERAAGIERELDIRPIDRHPGLRAALDALCGSHVYWFLRANGLPGAGERGVATSALAERLGVLPAYRRLFDYLLRVAVEDGLIVVDSDDLVCRTSRPDPPAPSVLDAGVRRDHAGFDGLLTLLSRCVAAYAEVLRVPGAATAVLYPGGTGERLTETLAESGNQYTWTPVAARLLREILVARAGRATGPLRLLEVGAGAGALTQEVAPALHAAGARVCITDVSRAFVDVLRQEADRRGLSTLRFDTLDISRDPGGQGFEPASFDAVIGLDVVHATRDVRVSLGHLETLLAPGGLLALIETVTADRWTNLIWGVSEGWWHFGDGIRTTTPLLSTEEWRSLFDELRPSSVQVVAEPSDASRSSDTALLLLERAGAPAEVSASDQRLPGRQADPADWFSVPSWEQLPPLRRREHVDPETWLVFADTIGVGAALAAELRRRGADVVVARPGAELSHDGADAYRLRPWLAGDYLSLLTNLRASERWPRHVVHCWSMGVPNGPDPLAAAADVQQLGLDGVILLMQAWGIQGDGSPLTLTVVTDGVCDVAGNEPLQPAQSTVVAAVKIVPREYPGVRGRSIDIAVPAGSAGGARTIAALADELTSPTEEPAVAMRGTRRWRETFVPARLEASPGATPVRDRGVYLIAGGLGAIGSALALSLAKQARDVRLVVTARTPLPPPDARDEWCAEHGPDDAISQRIARVRALEAAGATVMVCAVDVADERAMREAVAEARARFGRLDGVVHAAGQPDVGGVIQRRQAEDTRDALAAKVRGALVLDRVAGDDLDFFVLCSSIGSVLYNLKFGEIAYVAANDFLTAFAQERSRRAKGATIAIGWSDWAEAGMWAAARTQLQQSYATQLDEGASSEVVRAAIAGDLLHGITNREATEAFERILAQQRPHVIVSSQSLADLLERHRRYTPADHRAFLDAVQLGRHGHERPDIDAPYAPPRTPTERRLAEIWEELLGIDRVGIHDDFFELGGDSLLAIRILNRLHEDFGVDESRASMIDVSTIEALAARLDSVRAGLTPQG